MDIFFENYVLFLKNPIYKTENDMYNIAVSRIINIL